MPVNSARRVCIGHRVVALFNLEGSFHATDDMCTHGPASLAEDGLIEGETVECTLHGGVFHIPTGKPLKYPPINSLKVYQVEIAPDGQIYISTEDV